MFSFRFTPKSDIERARRDVSFVPKGDIPRCGEIGATRSPLSGGEERRRDRRVVWN